MSKSKVFFALAAFVVVAGVLFVESFGARSSTLAAASGSGPVKPVPWKHV